MFEWRYVLCGTKRAEAAYLCVLGCVLKSLHKEGRRASSVVGPSLYVRARLQAPVWSGRIVTQISRVQNWFTENETGF